MPGGNPSDALANYVRPLQRALACVHAHAQMITDCHNPRDGQRHYLAPAGNEPFRLSTASGQTTYSVFIGQFFEIVADEDADRGPWRATTRGYQYSVSASDDLGRELVAFHWHPAERGFDRPHLHIAEHPEAILQHAHVPTGRVSLESFIGFLIREFRVRARATNYQAILDASEEQFRKLRTWA